MSKRNPNFKTSWSDAHTDRVDKRNHKTYSGLSMHGKSSVRIECPFCFLKVDAYIWSLRGCGKRCECGAIHDAFSNSYRLKEPK